MSATSVGVIVTLGSLSWYSFVYCLEFTEAETGKITVKRVLIANRGEIALRVIRASRRAGLETVAVHSEADANSPHLWAADQAVCIGPAPALQSYLDGNTILHVAKATGCDAIHPGYGFLAENADFALGCEANDISFVGPAAESIEIMGDKAEARRAATRLRLRHCMACTSVSGRRPCRGAA